MIINHDNARYREKWNRSNNKWNGAFYYSKEICKYMIPNVQTDRNWITVNMEGEGCDHAIVFIHNNLHPEHYEWLSQYEDLILVCGVGETKEKVKHLGTPIYLPLSVKVDYVEQFIKEKTKKVAYVGRHAKMYHSGIKLPEGIDIVSNERREKLLPMMAEYEEVYAVGRTAIEAKILGCKVLRFDERYPSTRRWKILDTLDAAKMLQEKLDKIDKGE